MGLEGKCQHEAGTIHRYKTKIMTVRRNRVNGGCMGRQGDMVVRRRYRKGIEVGQGCLTLRRERGRQRSMYNKEREFLHLRPGLSLPALLFPPHAASKIFSNLHSSAS